LTISANAISLPNASASARLPFGCSERGGRGLTRVTWLMLPPDDLPRRLGDGRQARERDREQAASARPNGVDHGPQTQPQRAQLLAVLIVKIGDDLPGERCDDRRPARSGR
jgi:hypothetical protein